MPSPEMPRESQVPLVVDLDGTLIKTDLLWESLARLLRRNPFQLFPVLFWWTTRGRAFLKKKLAARVTIDPATLPFNEQFLAFLREQKRAGRRLILATASDREMAMPVASHVGLFDEVLGSDGKTNLRGANKLKVLTEQFGECGFDYAGNSAPDLGVWRGAREAIVVNASRALVQQAARLTRLGPTFIEDYSPFGTLKSFLAELFWRSGYLMAIGAGLLLTAAFPKIGVAGFAWIAPAMMMAAARGKRGGDAFRVGYVAGLTHFLSSLYWLLLMPVTGLPILAWLALGAYVALYPAVWVWLLANKIGEGHWANRTLWSLFGAAIWVALEMVRARLLGGFPWILIGVSQFKMIPLVQIASVTGVYGVSFLVVWLSLALYSAMRLILQRPDTRLIWQAEIMLPLVAILILFIFGFARMSGENPPAPVLRVTLVQPSIPQTLLWNPDEDEKRFEELLVQSQNALTNQTDLLLWPESAVPETDEATCRVISRFAQSNRVWIILNGEDAEYLPDTTNYFNAAYLIGPDGRWLQVYHKRKLVIFGEYIPLAHWLPFVKYLTPITDGWTPGDTPVTFEITRSGETPGESFGETNVIPLGGPSMVSSHQTIRISPLICFEDVFPGVARDAANDDTDFLVNLTNDGWFRQSAEQWQHMANAVFRAVENGVPLVRCANNGITCWIDAGGRVWGILKDKSGSVYGAGSMTVEIPIDERHRPTFYNRHGDWFGWGCVVLAAAIAIMKMRRNPSRRDDGD
jgi:apolipoprotein N-acyltransferase